jgi:hypothetical protein
VVVQANWKDNPFFPARLEAERQFTTRFITPTSIRTSGKGNMSRYSRGLITRRN